MEAHTCTICDHFYNFSAKRPLVLPCSHSFCQDCLQQVEAAGDKRCPVCRKDRGGVGVVDLLCCYQLIPAEGQTVKVEMKGASNEVAPYNEVCVQHGDEYIIWCLSCDVPVCKKCLKLKHRKCDYILIEEKLYISSIKDKYVQYSARLLDNKKELASIRSLVEKVTLLEKEKLDYQQKVEAWQVEADKILCNFKDNCQASADVKTALDLDENNCSPILDELEKNIPALPTPLLMHIASAHQTSPEDVDTFVSILHNSVETHREDGPSCDEIQAAKAWDLSIKEAVAAMSDGGDWVVSDATSAAAVRSVLQTTCFRPKKVEINWGDVPEDLIVDLQVLCNNCKKYWTLDCFHNIEKPSSETRASTSTKLNTLIEADRWTALTQFCGHLDAAAVQKLPATIKSVGLVLRDKEDMAAVNALAGAAFATGPNSKNTSPLKWLGWTDLNLSVAKTFRPDYWKLTWRLQSINNAGCGMITNVSLSTVLLALSVRLRLHLPQLVLGDRLWMLDLFRVMELKIERLHASFCPLVPLLLPGASIDPDPLLGVLKDSGQKWEVHLPTSLPQLVPREVVAERYKGYGHTVTWDLE